MMEKKGRVLLSRGWDVGSPDRDRVVAAALSLEGVRYRHQGRNRGGLDCCGVAFLVGWEAGVLPEGNDFTDYGRLPAAKSVHAELCRRTRLKPLRQARVGDILEFRQVELNWPIHMGVLYRSEQGRPALVHAWAQRRKVVAHDLDQRWLDRCTGVFEYPGVTG